MNCLPPHLSPSAAKPVLGYLHWAGLVLASVFLSGWYESEASAAEVSLGIEGHYRVGHWTAVRVTSGESTDSLETRDGDGVQVQYEQLQAASDWGYVIPGSEAAPLVLRSGDKVVASTRFPTAGSPSRGPAMIPLKMPWVVALGDPLGVDGIGANELLDRDALIAVSKPDRGSKFPDSTLGYSGVDVMIVGGSSIDLLRSLSDQQQQAIAGWVTQGGHLLVTLGDSAPRLMQAAPWLQSLLPIGPLTMIKFDPSAVETFTSSQTPLESFGGVKLPKDKGRVLILGRTTRRVSTPVAALYNVGFGQITVMAADLENELFSTWPNRLELITRLTGSILVPDQETPNRKTRATAFDDLAGQTRATLDQFAIKRYFGFSVVSLILMALIAAIGPLDYLVINRVLGRPLLGWISFPLVTVGLSVILAIQARPVAVASQSSNSAGQGELQAETALTRCNRMEIFDIDSMEGTARGFSVSYLYSHDAARFDVSVEPSPSLVSISKSRPQILTTPFGYPGESFGGIQIAIEDARLPIYQVAFESGQFGNALRGTQLLRVPLASRSSKGLSTLCRFEPKLTPVSLQHRPGSELLQGELINPLPLDLLDGMLIYRNWAYLLPTRFPAGGRIASIDSLRQKNFRWQLSRQRALESASESEAWDPSDTQSLGRVAEMLMFHDAVGAARYTSLEHDPLSFLDLSHVLTEDRCILVARTVGEMTEFQTRDSRAEANEAAVHPSGKRLTMIRVVIPVTDSLQL